MQAGPGAHTRVGSGCLSETERLPSVSPGGPLPAPPESAGVDLGFLVEPAPEPRLCFNTSLEVHGLEGIFFKGRILTPLVPKPFAKIFTSNFNVSRYMMVKAVKTSLNTQRRPAPAQTPGGRGAFCALAVQGRECCLGFFL